MRAIIGLVDSQKKVPPSAPVISLAEDTGSNRDFDNGAASLTWTTPTFNGKSAIVGYDITATADDNSVVTFSTGVVNNSSITGLKSGKKYTYRIKARNGGGAGADSAGKGPVTATTKPGIPVNVTAVNLNNGSQATVTWTAGSNGGSPITGYTVTVSPGGATTNTTNTSVTIGSLTNNSSYTFTVTATNVNGTSLPSSASNSITITQPVVVPPPPPQTGCTSCYQDSGSAYCSGSNTVINQVDPCCNRTTTTRTVSGNPLNCGVIGEVFTPCPVDSGSAYCSGSNLVINQVDLCANTIQPPRVITVGGCIVPPTPPLTCCQDDDAGFCNNGTWFQYQYDPCGSSSCAPRNTGSSCISPTVPQQPTAVPTTAVCLPTGSITVGNCTIYFDSCGGAETVCPPTPTAAPTAAPQPTATPTAVSIPTTTGPFAPWPEYFYTGVGGPPAAPRPQYPYYCLSIDSMIPTPNGDKRLAELVIGDQIISARFEEIDPDDPNADLIVDTWSSDSFTYRELDITTVVNIREWEETGRYTINNRIKVTGSHPFIAKESADGRYYYTRAAQLVEGDMLFDGDLEAWVPVHSIDYEPNVRFKVRTLSTEPYDMFFAEGILVHNK
jgi:hypothetical protein